MTIQYEKDDHVAIITLDNALHANVIDKEHAVQLGGAWKSAWEDRDIRAIVITGAGDQHFCGGHDLSQRNDINELEAEFLALERIFRPPGGYVNGFQSGIDGGMADHFPRIYKPVVAAVNGWAVGAGLYLLLASTDIRVAALENAKFRFGLISRGWVGAGPGATLLIKQLRFVDAMRMLLTDATINAEDAVRIGLVNETAPPDRLMNRALDIARHIATLPPLATSKMKEFVHRYSDLPVEQAWNIQSMINGLLLQTTEDAQEGRRSFTERRAPNVTGQYRGFEEHYENLGATERARLEQLRREIDW